MSAHTRTDSPSYLATVGATPSDSEARRVQSLLIRTLDEIEYGCLLEFSFEALCDFLGG